MSHAAPAPPDHRHDLSDPRRWQALSLLCLAQFMVILDITVVNVALPAIGADLSLDRAALTWVVTAYTLCFGGLMLLGGRLADLLGRRRMFLAGLGTFTLASLGAGLPGDGTALVAARALQGVGAALLSPAALSVITTTFQGRERYRALGVWGALGGAGAAVGVLLGGTLSSGPGWQVGLLRQRAGRCAGRGGAPGDRGSVCAVRLPGGGRARGAGRHRRRRPADLRAG